MDVPLSIAPQHGTGTCGSKHGRALLSSAVHELGRRGGPQALTRDARTVPGGGATEMELARKLAELGRTETGLEQYAIAKFAEALEVSSPPRRHPPAVRWMGGPTPGTGRAVGSCSGCSVGACGLEAMPGEAGWGAAASLRRGCSLHAWSDRVAQATGSMASCWACHRMSIPDGAGAGDTGWNHRSGGG